MLCEALDILITLNSLSISTNKLFSLSITIHNPNFIHIIICSQGLRIDGWKQIPDKILSMTLLESAKVVIRD